MKLMFKPGAMALSCVVSLMGCGSETAIGVTGKDCSSNGMVGSLAGMEYLRASKPSHLGASRDAPN